MRWDYSSARSSCTTWNSDPDNLKSMVSIRIALSASGLVVEEIPVDFQRFPGSRQSQFEAFDADQDGVLSGALGR